MPELTLTLPGEQQLAGIAASPGICLGPAFWYAPPELKIPARPPEAPAAEWARFEAAQAQAQAELEALRDTLQRRGKPAEAAIFGAHLEMLADPMLAEAVRAAVDGGALVEQAVASAAEQLAQLLGQLADELFAARAADVRDVGRRVLRCLLGQPGADLCVLASPAIVVAADLTPSDTAALDPDMVLGFCTVAGGATSHSAILARTLGIPAVVGLGAALPGLAATGTELILDGDAGLVFAAPAPATRRRYVQARARRRAEHLAWLATAHAPAVTLDGRPVEVAANIGELQSAREAVAQGADGVGLLRTEFLYLDAAQPPPEERQVGIYRAIFEALEGRPVIVRTLDIGGDKPPAYLPFPAELNPFLGWRAIRVCLEQPTLFKTQLRAILRAAVGHPVRVMFPMIDDLDELLAARALVAEAAAELERAGLPYAAGVPVGIMVETPAAALMVEHLAEAADFFSLGTNDLTQYTLAVDRGNPKVAGLFQPLHPAVLRLVRATIEAAHARGKWVGMCGELAGLPAAIPILLGLGLDEFSMAPRAIPAAKHFIRRLSLPQAQAIAAHALALPSGRAVVDYMQSVLAELPGEQPAPATDLQE